MDSSLKDIRYANTPFRNTSFYIVGSKINLDNLSYPVTFWPKTIDSSRAQLTLSFGNSKPYSFSFNPSDSTFFSITLSSFNNNLLIGTFAGKLFNPAKDDSVIVTNGQFSTKLKVW